MLIGIGGLVSAFGDVVPYGRATDHAGSRGGGVAFALAELITDQSANRTTSQGAKDGMSFPIGSRCIASALDQLALRIGVPISVGKDSSAHACRQQAAGKLRWDVLHVRILLEDHFRLVAPMQSAIELLRH